MEISNRVVNSRQKDMGDFKHAKKIDYMRGLIWFLFMIVIYLIVVGSATAKSVYLAAEHHTQQFDAWNLNPGGTVTKQATYALQYASDPAGIAIDNDSETLFITSELSGGVELVDTKTLTSLGVSSGPSNLAGIDIDDVNDIVYTIRRSSNELYIFDWDAATNSITQTDLIFLPNISGAFGLALDETRNILWIADTAGGKIRAFNVGTWTEDTSKSFTPSHNPVDVAVDRVRNLIYSVSIIGGAIVPGGTGSNLLSKFDVASKTETTINMGHAGVGVAVDEITGYVYVTGGANTADNITLWDTSTSPFTKLQDTGPIGNPAGIAIGNVSWNPLNLVKNGIIQGQGVQVDDTFTYEITFDNPPIDLTGVKITDQLPPELDFVSVTQSGAYDPTSHTVEWDLGSIAAGQAVPVIHLTVRVNQTAQPGSTIYNDCTLDGDQAGYFPTTVQDLDPNDPTGANLGIPVLTIDPLTCDIDSNSQVDRNDISEIFAARGTAVTLGDIRDFDNDGLITINDARGCVLQCTNTRCSP